MEKIPQRTVPDPYVNLWALGFPQTQTSWLMTEERRKSPLMDSLTKDWDAHPEYMEYRFSRWHPEDVGIARDVASTQLAKMLREKHRAMLENIDTADQKWKEAQKEWEGITPRRGSEAWTKRKLEQAKRDNGIRKQIRDAADYLNFAIARAQDFDEIGSVEDLIKGMKAAIKAQQASFNAHARAIEVAPVSVVLDTF